MEFGGVRVGDVRRTRRLVKMAEALAETPSGTLPNAFAKGGQLKGAYRFLSGSGAKLERLIEPHCRRTREECNRPGEYLILEDTTELDFTTHAGAAGMGRIGNDSGRGLYLHTALAVRVDRWSAEGEAEVTMVGLFGQRVWARGPGNFNRGKSRGERLSRPRESQVWAAVFEETGGPAAKARWTFIGDRESDIYEVFEQCLGKGIDLIIRSRGSRAMVDQAGSLYDAAARAPVKGRFSVDLRARPGQKARKAELELRATEVTLRGPWRPDRQPAPLKINLVEAREVNAPAGVGPLNWVLMTTWPVESFDQALRVVKAYARRWLTEEYHKALKTGTHMEESQLETVERIEALLGILVLVALRLLKAKLLARSHAEQRVPEGEIEPHEWTVLNAIADKPPGGWTYGTMIRALARLGGFLGRKSDGNPGWITIWRGYFKLYWMAQGIALIQGS